MLAALLDPWAWRMAWRDSRSGRRRLALYASAMAVGVAALVAIDSFGANVRAALAEQARDLVGADLRLAANAPFDDETEALVAERLAGELGGERADAVSFSSMVWAPEGGGVRLARVRAIDPGFPFYGELTTDPPEAAARLRASAAAGGASAGTPATPGASPAANEATPTHGPTRPAALLDEALMLQLDLQPGDTLRVGAFDYEVAGRLRAVPGESASAALFGPRVYLPRAHLDPELLVRGSRVRHEAFFRFGPEVDVGALREELAPHLEARRMRSSTPESREERWSESLDDMRGFLSLVSFVALLLGGLGVGASMSVWVRGKLDTVATLRCLGATSARAFAVFGVQAAALGAVGAALGALAGLLVQRLLPAVVATFLPVTVETALAPAAVAQGAGVGLGVALLFALLPLLAVRRVPPLAALRAVTAARRDPLRWLAGAALLLAVGGFAWRQTGELRGGLAFAAGTAVAFAVLALVGRCLSWLVRRAAPRGLGFVWRQGLANLHRPQNQTVLLSVALGLGTFLVLTLHLVQEALLGQVSFTDRDGRPNVVLFDIQSDQRDAVAALVAGRGLPLVQQVPMVTMRLSAVAGRPVAERRDGRGDGRGDWAERREYRSTYRDHLTDTETLVAGALESRPWAGEGPVGLSLERDLAQELGVGLGDALTWDVQGVPVESVVTSLREVEWQRMQTNFFAVFPPGVLEQAPQFHVLVTRAESPEQVAGLQRALVEAFPNVSVIDVSLILAVADAVLDQVAALIRFMAGFSVLAGALVLFAAVVVTRTQRIEESVLLRTLGATRRQVLAVMNVEFVMLGAVASATGALLSLASTWALLRFRFEMPFSPAAAPLAVTLVAVCGLTWAVGRLHSRGIHDRPPLAVLRQES